MFAPLKGKDLMLALGDTDNVLTAICYSKTCSLNRERDTLTILDPSSEDESYLPGKKRGTISASGVIVLASKMGSIEVLEYLESGASIYFAFTTSDKGGIKFTGRALITSWQMTGSVDEMSSYDFSGKIQGKLKIIKSPIVKEVYLANANGVQLIGCPNPYPVAIFWYDGALIGPATNPDEVISVFNAYSVSHGDYYTLQSSVDGGCRFVLSIAYDAPMQPNFVIAEQNPNFALSTNQDIYEVLSNDQLNDNALTPILDA